MSIDDLSQAEREELALLEVDAFDRVIAYGGLLEVRCYRSEGMWYMVAVWAGHEHTLFEAPLTPQ